MDRMSGMQGWPAACIARSGPRASRMFFRAWLEISRRAALPCPACPLLSTSSGGGGGGGDGGTAGLLLVSPSNHPDTPLRQPIHHPPSPAVAAVGGAVSESGNFPDAHEIPDPCWLR